jgi:hypothetical protein
MSRFPPRPTSDEIEEYDRLKNLKKEKLELQVENLRLKNAILRVKLNDVI